MVQAALGREALLVTHRILGRLVDAQAAAQPSWASGGWGPGSAVLRTTGINFAARAPGQGTASPPLRLLTTTYESSKVLWFGLTSRVATFMPH